MSVTDDMNTPSIEINNAALAYADQSVFSAITLTVAASKWTALLGPSGIGKSSFLRMIAGLTVPQEVTQGMIQASNNIPLEEQIAYMGQTDLLLPWLTVLDNVMLPYHLRRIKTTALLAAELKAQALLESVDLANATTLYPHQLSGGMRQRVALARTLMQEKPIILMDEPFSALDAITRYHLHALAISMLRGKTVLFITHDPAEALRLADSIYIMRGQPANLYHISDLTSVAPRHFNHPDVIQLQELLFQELTGAKGEMA